MKQSSQTQSPYVYENLIHNRGGIINQWEKAQTDKKKKSRTGIAIFLRAKKKKNQLDPYLNP